MFPLFETLAIEQGVVQNIAYHQARYERSLRTFYGESAVKMVDLLALITPPPEWCDQLVRCRIDYNATQTKVQYFQYARKTYRTFHPVVCDEIDYGLKYADRTLFNALFNQRGDCDEIIIIKNGCVTDCSIGNLIFRQGNQWVTPDTPLLKGTQREKLLREGKIQARRILAGELECFEEIRVINAMNGLSD